MFIAQRFALVFLHLLRLGEGTIPYFAISWFNCSCNSALFGKYNW